jgi:hypothetical protein
VRSLCDPPTSVNELPPPLAMDPDGLGVEAVEPVLEPGEVDPGYVEPGDVEPGEGLEAVEPVLEPVAPGVEPVVDPVLPGEVAEGLVLEPVVDPGEEPMLPAPLLDTLAPVSLKLPPEEAELPAVPVAPVVPVPAAVLPAPDSETRQPVTTTVLLPVLLLLPAGSGVPPGVCAAAPAPSATAIIVPKRNCRFITRPPCWVNEVPYCAARSEGHNANAGPFRFLRRARADPQSITSRGRPRAARSLCRSLLHGSIRGAYQHIRVRKLELHAGPTSLMKPARDEPLIVVARAEQGIRLREPLHG